MCGCKGNIISVSAKCSDMCVVKSEEAKHEGYVPENLGIGGGDYIKFDLCLSCGKIQDSFPKEFEGFEDESN